MKIPTKKTLDGHLHKITWLSVVVAVALAVLSATMVTSSATTDVTLAHMTKDELGSSGKTVLAPASEILATVQLRYIFTALMVISAILSLLLVTKLRKNYLRMLKTNVSGWRWLFMGIGAALLLEFAYLLVGINDLLVLKLGGGLVLTTALLGWLSERENKIAGRPKWLAFTISILTGVLAWLPIVGSLIGTTVYGSERFPWHVYAFCGVLLVGFVAYGLNQYLQLKKTKAWRDYFFSERNYLLIGVLVKVFVGAIILAALHK
jgi:hypothetical protein